MLTGGRAANELYAQLADDPRFSKLEGVRFFFGDERAVPLDHPESNFGNASRTLFKRGLPANCCIERIPAESDNLEQVAKDYAAKIPAQLDLLLLSVGEDGHIASLFPNNYALREKKKLMLPVIGPKTPCRRVTISPLVIPMARHIIILACGPGKLDLLKRAKSAPEEIENFPARLVLGGEWIISDNTLGIVDQFSDLFFDSLKKSIE